MILDNGRFHTVSRLVIPPNVHLVFLPPYSSELNLVERVSRHLTYAFASYPTLADLRQRTRQVVTKWSDEVLLSLTGCEYLLYAAHTLLAKVLILVGESRLRVI